jgi:hypothetical protein
MVPYQTIDLDPSMQAYSVGNSCKVPHWGLDEAERVYTLPEKKTDRAEVLVQEK